MILNLQAHPRSLYATALKHDDPLRILRVLNHVSKWSTCSITMTKPGANTTQLAFVFRGHKDNPPSIFPSLDGVVPEVFDCDEMIFGQAGYLHRLSEPRSALDKTRKSLDLQLVSSVADGRADSAQLFLINYHRPFVLPEFTSADTVIARLRTDTLMHCGNATLGDRTVVVSLLTAEPQTIRRTGFNRLRRRNLEEQGASVCTITHRFDEDAVLVDLLLWASKNPNAQRRLQLYAGAVPVTWGGASGDQRVLQPLRIWLDSQAQKYFGVAMEISAPDGLLSYDLDHSVIPDPNCRRMVDRVSQWVESIGEGDTVCKLSAVAGQHRDVQLANSLQERQRRLERSGMVFLRGEPILQEPQSEKDVLALYFKLEGAGVLPFESCCVLEHTPARGTDAIGHFRVASADAINQYAPIEFEHRFANFVTHGHSVRHVDLVICWSASSKDLLRATKQPWLMTHSGADVDKTIPVLVLSRIPELEVRDG